MDSRASFVCYISADYSIDDWSDVAIDHAIELANDLSSSDWAELRDSWMNLEPNAQARIAEVAGETASDSRDIGPMLVTMLSSESVDVVEASLDSLNSICQRMPDRVDMDQLRIALRSVKPADHVVAIVFDSLKRIVDAQA